MKKPDDGALPVLKKPGVCCQPNPKVNGPTVPLPSMLIGLEMLKVSGVSGLRTLEEISKGPTVWVLTTNGGRVACSTQPMNGM